MSLDCIAADLTAIRSELKSLTKIVRKIKAKQEDPDGEKAKKRAENNGFNRKQKITEKLATFLGLEKTELVSRSEVTKSINKYITEKGLKHPENGRVLVMDDKLKELLQPGETQVTYLNLQKFLSPHYVKEDKA
jgi:chromatin remodeling complex protein RSC6|tara:strand:+ start:1771 stop:2172 length:402 start_codon:yes stop_codon:yes gene_type:complete